jgi:secreted trypsin-like serine protease
MFRIPLAAMAILGMTVACQNADEPLLIEGTGSAVSSKIFSGSPPTLAEHDAVVALHKLAKGGRSVYVSPFCSGTLIRGDVVVTAAHCMSGVSPNKVAIFVGDEASTDAGAENYIFNHLYSVSEISTHPSYNSFQLTNDIALMRLDSDAAAAEGISPVPELPGSEDFTEADVGVTNLNFAGFGVTESGSFGTKLQVDVVLGGLGCSVAGCPSPGDSTTQISYTQPTGGPCSGDSGGPAFIDRAGTTYVAGLTSYGDAGCVVYGVSTNVAPFEGFIGDFVGISDTGDTGLDTGDTGLDTCGDGVCGVGESCDGQAGTTECTLDCDGKTNGKPSGRYCYVEGTCVGDGCP